MSKQVFEIDWEGGRITEALLYGLLNQYRNNLHLPIGPPYVVVKEVPPNEITVITPDYYSANHFNPPQYSANFQMKYCDVGIANASSFTSSRPKCPYCNQSFLVGELNRDVLFPPLLYTFCENSLCKKIVYLDGLYGVVTEEERQKMVDEKKFYENLSFWKKLKMWLNEFWKELRNVNW